MARRVQLFISLHNRHRIEFDLDDPADRREVAEVFDADADLLEEPPTAEQCLQWLRTSEPTSMGMDSLVQRCSERNWHDGDDGELDDFRVVDAAEVSR